MAMPLTVNREAHAVSKALPLIPQEKAFFLKAGFYVNPKEHS
jgi:hypothetical protein